MSKERKAKILSQLKEEFKGLNGVVLASFKGIPVSEIEALRKKIKKEKAKAIVAKNTLIDIALNENGIKGMDPFLKGETIVFTSKEDILPALKQLVEVSKTNEKFIIKGGYFDNTVFDSKGIVELSKLPGKKEILAMILGNMTSIISNVAGVMNTMISSTIATIEAIEKKKAESQK